MSTGEESWKKEVAELRTLAETLASELSALKKSSVNPAQLGELQATLTTLQGELKTLRESMPDSKAAEKLASNLEAKIAELAGKVTTLTTLPPQPPKPAPAGDLPEAKTKRDWL